MTNNSPFYFTVATAGHVDHGKTSVLRSLTGIDPDRLKEEKLRQMTTDLGFAHINLRNKKSGEDLVVGFIDVPGHGKFLKNMLAGVGGIRMALLVVAADEGPMPQTQAHVKILRMLGIREALTVLTKNDLASAEQQQDALDRTTALLTRYGITEVDRVRVTNPSKMGFDQLKDKLVQVLTGPQADATKPYQAEVPVYLPVDRVFTKTGYGLVVTGTLLRGTIKTGDSMFIEPGHLKARVRGLETFGHTLSTATAGQRLAINLNFREHTQLVRGQCVLGEELTPCTTVIAALDVTDDLDDKNLNRVLANQQIRLYHGTAESTGHVSWCELRGGHTIIQVRLNEPLVAEPGDRFVLRYGDTGITGGELICTARPRWLTRPKLMDIVNAVTSKDYDLATNLFLDACSQRLVRIEALNCLQPRNIREKLISDSVAKGSLIRLADYLATRESIDILSAKLTNELKARAGETDNKYTPLETLRGRVLPGIERTAFQAFLKILVESGQIVRKGDRLLFPRALSTDVSPKPTTQTDLENEILKILADCCCLEIDEIAKQTNNDRKIVIAALNQLSKETKATIVNFDFAATNQKLHHAHKVLAEIWQRKKDISPSEFRESLGTTRKYAMALLSHFDDQAVTRRVNNTRVLLKSPKVDLSPE